MSSPTIPARTSPAANLGTVTGALGDPATNQPTIPPMYWRVLRLSAVRPNGWQRAILVEGVTGIAVILALADVASAWAIVLLPLASVVVVKAHDYLAGLLRPQAKLEPPPARAADYAVFGGLLLSLVILRFFVHASGQKGETIGIVVGAIAVSFWPVLSYRYMVRRGVPKRRAVVVAALTGLIGAAYEVRRHERPSGTWGSAR